MARFSRIKSFDGVALAAYTSLQAPVSSKRVIFSHATGFHGQMFNKTVKMLSPDFNCLSIDHRGHGMTKWEAKRGGPDSWEIFGDDMVTLSRGFMDSKQGNNSLIGVGHSMGASALLIAAMKDPTLFKALVLFEPIRLPPSVSKAHIAGGQDAPLAVLARKRRNTFESFSSALDNFLSKKPFRVFDPDVVRDYVSHGFVAVRYNDMDMSSLESGDDILGERIITDSTAQEICLRCAPDYEAEVYNTVSSYYITDEMLQSLDNIPVVVLSGTWMDQQPSSWAEHIARQLPRGELQRWEDAGHFGPFEKPERLAEVIRSVAEKFA